MNHCSFLRVVGFSCAALFPAISEAQTPPPAAPASAAAPPGSTATQPAAPAPAQPAPPPQAYPAPPPAYPPPAAQPQGYPPPPPATYPPPAEAAWNAPPPHLPYESGQPIPQGYVLESGIRRGPVIAGSIVLGVPYVLGVTLTDLEEQRVWLVVPVVGPWITLAGGDYSCDETSSFDCADERSGRTLLVLDGLMQGTGAILLLYGLLSPRERLVRQDLYRGLTLTPQFSAGAAGLLATGEF